uniref:Uncharacterized protein n=1 Tax=Nymphaea colorata TaxID=210225 RepID=A0A5K1E6C4_9MAGN
MARWSLKAEHGLGSAQAGAMGLAGLILSTFVLTMCAFRLKRRRRRHLISHMFISNPTAPMNAEPQPLTTKAIRCTRPGEDGIDESFVSQELCLWKKNILMGEKCQPPEFSGVIMYDSAGKLVSPAVPRITYPPW